VNHRSFRGQLAFSIAFAVTRSRALLRQILNEHAPDDARQMLAVRVIEHLEQSGFETEPQLARRFSLDPFHSVLASISFLAAAVSSASASRPPLVQ
jgi:hypothetical protein